MRDQRAGARLVCAAQCARERHCARVRGPGRACTYLGRQLFPLDPSRRGGSSRAPATSRRAGPRGARSAAAAGAERAEAHQATRACARECGHVVARAHHVLRSCSIRVCCGRRGPCRDHCGAVGVHCCAALRVGVTVDPRGCGERPRRSRSRTRRRWHCCERSCVRHHRRCAACSLRVDMGYALVGSGDRHGCEFERASGRGGGRRETCCR